MEFKCISDCSQCCIEREYYPSKKFGKIGVLILPEEKLMIEKLSKKNRIKIKILPRIGTSEKESFGPTKILAYQLMGIEKNGNTCPFLDLKNEDRSPHGGLICKIYEQRPLACRAYPVIESNPLILDKKCKFCVEYGSADRNLNSELESLIQIKAKIRTNSPHIWRFATGVGDKPDKNYLQKGWKLEK